MVMPTQTRPPVYHGQRMTAAEFDLLPAEHDGYLELIEGVIFMAGGASVGHQRLLRILLTRLSGLVTSGEWFTAPLTLALEGDNRFEPDIFWIAPGTPVTYEYASVVGAPDLVIEIVSPSTGKQDKTTKFDVYERSGVKEYWLADPNLATVDVFVLREGRYSRHGSYGAGDSFDSPALGETVTLDGVFTTP